ncbi:MAG: Coenzyme F420 hydrogenase/dehydrogenase, beta subunit C-terminal domain [Lentisphaeria bacterium]|nr:Coenzyme F420 hydrogenase/dehydrogenase, beta subunit C-terminal domain [Lentisphaeria bacterium]
MKIGSQGFLEAVKYTAGCGGGLLLKVLITSAATYLRIPLRFSYLIAAISLLFFSFFFHRQVTFRSQTRNGSKGSVLRDFALYVPGVLAFKVLDYVLVVMAAGALRGYLQNSTELTLTWIQIINTSCIFSSSAVLFTLRFFVYKVIFHKWSEADLDYYTGKAVSVYEGYSARSEIAANAASGGFVTGMLTHLLESNRIDGALVSRLEADKGEITPVVEIVTKASDLMRFQGSIYMSYPLLSAEILDKIHAFSGRLAIVALPCQCRGIRKRLENDPALQGRSIFLIGLFCGHTSQPALLDRVLERKKIRKTEIRSFRFRRGLGRGYSEIVLHNGTRITFPSAAYLLYQNLFVEAAPQCAACFDHFAEAADLACGDVWTWRHRRDKIKHSIFCSRTEAGEEALQEAIRSGCFVVERSDRVRLLRANIRAAIYHKAIAARAEAAARYGKKLPIPPQARPARWNERLAARLLARLNQKQPERILKMNRRYLKILLYVFKGLTNF